jgi:hypothetical protein
VDHDAVEGQRLAGAHNPSTPGAAPGTATHVPDAKALVVEIAIHGVAIGAAFAFAPLPEPDHDEIGWTTHTDPDGW